VKSSDGGGPGGARPRILYLLTDEISSVLVRGQLGHLVHQGFDVMVATRLDRPTRVAGADGRWDAGVLVEHLPFVRQPSPIADLRALVATVALVRRLRPSIVNASTPKAGLLGMLAARVCRVPVRVYVVRGYRFETATGGRRRVLMAFERMAARCANHVVFNSASLMAVGVREGLVADGHGVVIGAGSGNGVDVARFADVDGPSRDEARQRFGLNADAMVIGFVGRFSRDKGIDDLVTAFERLRARHECQLLLVGQYDTGDPIRTATRHRIDTDPHIVVVPWVDDPVAAYRSMDVLAFPSAREGLPNVLLEAQLCGVPVVAYSATGTIDAVCADSADLLVPIGDIDGLCAKIEAVIGQPVNPSRSDAGRRWVSSTFERTVFWAALSGFYQHWLAEG
jgi:glycosyltransferase involved in cell wall biosynthesis